MSKIEITKSRACSPQLLEMSHPKTKKRFAKRTLHSQPTRRQKQPELSGVLKFDYEPHACGIDGVWKFNKIKNISDSYKYILGCPLVFDEVPYFSKSDCQFVVDVSKFKSPHGQRWNFYDDCGVWDYQRKTYNAYHYLIKGHDNFEFMDLVKGRYGRNKKTISSKKYVFTELDPQPTRDQVLRVVKYDLKHRLKPEFRRTVFMCEAVGTYLAIYQYEGSVPDNIRKFRTRPQLIDIVKENLTASAKDVYQKDAHGGDSMLNQRIIENAKYRAKSKLRRENKLAGSLT